MSKLPELENFGVKPCAPRSPYSAYASLAVLKFSLNFPQLRQLIARPLSFILCRPETSL